MATDIETVFNLHLMIMIMTCYIKRLSQHSLSGIYAGPCHAYCGCLWIYILLAYTVTLQIINYPQSTQQHFSCKKGPTCLFDPPEASRSRIFSRPGGLYIVSKTRNHCLIVVFSGMKFDKEGKTHFILEILQSARPQRFSSPSASPSLRPSSSLLVWSVWWGILVDR